MQEFIAQKLAHLSEVLEPFGYNIGIYLPQSALAHDISFLEQFTEGGMPLILDEAIDASPLQEAEVYIISDNAWQEKLDVLVPVYFSGYAGPEIDALKRKCDESGLSVTINDQTCSPTQINESDETVRVSFRGLELAVKPGTVFPFGYVNDPFIDLICAEMNGNAASMLELCTGSGCIGLALMNELAELKRALLVDLSPYACFSATENLYRHKPDGMKKANVLRSKGFSKVAKSETFDLIVANPPHRDKVANRIQDYGGADVDWGFHLDFFGELSERLTPSGAAYLLENGREGFVPKKQLLEFMKNSPVKDFQLKCTPIAGSEFYVAKITCP